MSTLQKAYISALALLAVFVVLVAWLAIYQTYSPMPYADSWDGLIMFVYGFVNGSFWEKAFQLVDQHNEHRVFYSRILFLTDYFLFKGSFVLLYTFNALIPFLGIYVFYRVTDSIDPKTRLVVLLAVTAMLFSLRQWENFLWEFQSQFFMAYYLPLFFYFVFLCCYGEGLVRNAAILLIIAILSALTMANGVFFAIPLVFFFLFFRNTRGLSAIALAIFVLVLVLYLVILPYTSNPGHGSFQRDVLTDPLRYSEYVLTYLGAPAGSSGALFAGTIVLVLVFVVLFKAVLNNDAFRLRNALLLYLMFYIFTVLVTGIGRVNFGVEQAMAWRYMTPTLLAWACLLVLLTLEFSQSRWARRSVWMTATLLMLSSANYQAKKYNRLYAGSPDHETARLALYLDVNDPEVLRSVYPNDNVKQKFAAARDLGFAVARPRDGWTTNGEAAEAARACKGEVLAALKIDDRYVRISGLLTDPQLPSDDQSFEPVYVVDGVIAGVGVRGGHYSDRRSEAFVVYVEKDKFAAGGRIHSQSGSDTCFLPDDLQKWPLN